MSALNLSASFFRILQRICQSLVAFEQRLMSQDKQIFSMAEDNLKLGVKSYIEINLSYLGDLLLKSPSTFSSSMTLLDMVERASLEFAKNSCAKIFVSCRNTLMTSYFIISLLKVGRHLDLTCAGVDSAMLMTALAIKDSDQSNSVSFLQIQKTSNFFLKTESIALRNNYLVTREFKRINSELILSQLPINDDTFAVVFPFDKIKSFAEMETWLQSPSELQCQSGYSNIFESQSVQSPNYIQSLQQRSDWITFCCLLLSRCSELQTLDLSFTSRSPFEGYFILFGILMGLHYRQCLINRSNINNYSNVSHIALKGFSENSKLLERFLTEIKMHFSTITLEI